MTDWIVSGILFIISIPLLMGKGAWLLAGYNTASKEAKIEYEKKYDITKVCKTMGFMLLILSIILFISEVFPNEQYEYMYVISVCTTIGITLIYANWGCKRK